MPAEELVRICAESGDGDAWKEFVVRYHRPISLSVLRIARQWGQTSRALIDDLVQETYLKLCANRCRALLQFSAQHPEAVAGYIKTVAVNVTHDYFKARYSQKRGAGEGNPSLEAVEHKASSAGPQTVEREVMLKQIHQCLESCSQGPHQDRDRLIFWLYYRQGFSAKEISNLPGICLTVEGVESAILRLTRMVRKRVAGR